SQVVRRGRQRIAIEPCEFARDDEGELLSVPFKMEMEMREFDGCDPRVLVERTKWLLDGYWVQFMAVVYTFGITVVAKEEKQLVIDGRRCILPFQLSCPHWQSALTQFVSRFFIQLRRNHVPSFEMPTIATHLLLYPLRLINLHENLPLAYVQFGSLTNGRLDLHWILREAATPDDRNDGAKIHQDLYIFFEYDKRSIHIDYCNLDPNPENPDKDSVVRGKISV
ncbi:hypothetical protein PMAYCL1PPCAC_21182, partial [Pristionchus mayeri]